VDAAPEIAFSVCWSEGHEYAAFFLHRPHVDRRRPKGFSLRLLFSLPPPAQRREKRGRGNANISPADETQSLDNRRALIYSGDKILTGFTLSSTTTLPS
jgi:hypothetical protein